MAVTGISEMARAGGHEWRREILPDCLGKAQEAIARLRSQGIRVELKGNWLVFDLGDTQRDARAFESLDHVWPDWRDCVND